MKATKKNSTGQCHRCGEFKPYVLASAFYEDGGFRFLCSQCDRIERELHQLRLFQTSQSAIAVWLDSEPEVEEEADTYIEPDPPQMSLFG